MAFYPFFYWLLASLSLVGFSVAILSPISRWNAEPSVLTVGLVLLGLWALWMFISQYPKRLLSPVTGLSIGVVLLVGLGLASYTARLPAWEGLAYFILISCVVLLLLACFQWVFAECQPVARVASLLSLISMTLLLGLLSMQLSLWHISQQSLIHNMVWLGLVGLSFLLLLLAALPIGFSWGLSVWLHLKIWPKSSFRWVDSLTNLQLALSDIKNKADFESRWQAILQQSFHPLAFQKCPEALTKPQYTEYGLQLLVPSLDQQSYYQLAAKQQGVSLFHQGDVQHCQVLWQIAQIAKQSSDERHQAVIQERQRIMYDLHDSLGAKLLTLMHKLPNAQHKTLVREALTTLRDTVRLSVNSEEIHLGDLFANWRGELAERTEAAGVELQWQLNDLCHAFISTMQAIELTHVFRELTTNALKHAEPTYLSIQLSCVEQRLRLVVQHDLNQIRSADFKEMKWTEGTGINSIRQRLTRRAGSLQFQWMEQGTEQQLIAEVRVDISANT